MNNLVNPAIPSTPLRAGSVKRKQCKSVSDLLYLCDFCGLCLPAIALATAGGYNNSVAKEKMKKDIVVVGLGNMIMADEGIGCAVINLLSARKQEYPNVEFVDLGTGGINLLHIISGRGKVIIVDCALMGTEPGTIKRFTPEQVKSVKQLSHYSGHEADVLKIIDMSRQLGECPERIVIFGIEPLSIEPKQQLSETLSAKLTEYASSITEELRA